MGLGGTLVCSVAVSVKMNVLLLAPPLLLLLLKVSNAKMSPWWGSDVFHQYVLNISSLNSKLLQILLL